MWAKFWFGLTAVLVIAAMLIGACAPTPTPQVIREVVVATPTPPPPTPRPDRVVLRFLTIQDQAQINAWKEILEEFKKIDGGKWSYVDIEFESVPFRELFPKIEASVAAGLPWDLVQADGPDMKHYGFNRVLLPLGEYFTEEELKQWFPQSIEEGSFRGQLYGPPMMQSCSLMMYNTEMTDAAGIKPPDKLEDSWTMEEPWSPGRRPPSIRMATGCRMCGASAGGRGPGRATMSTASSAAPTARRAAPPTWAWGRMG